MKKGTFPFKSGRQFYCPIPFRYMNLSHKVVIFRFLYKEKTTGISRESKVF